MRTEPAPVFPIRSIVIATDFLESSRLALDYAVALAHHYKAKLHVLNVFRPSQAATEAELFHDGPSLSRRNRESRLEALAAGARRAGVEVEWHLLEGWMPDTLLARLEAQTPDLLVMGTHGIYHGLGHFLIGSDAEATLLSTPCPTLTIGRHVLSGVRLNLAFDRISYVTDFSPEAAVAAPYAVALSQEFGAVLEVCHLIPEDIAEIPELRNQLAQQYCEAMKRVLPSAEEAWCTTAYQLAQGAPAEDIVRRARLDTDNLIVLGVRATSLLERHLHQSLAYQLVATAVCPVLTIRA
jgi:nucleotide-binding universal stress UspA family protein